MAEVRLEEVLEAREQRVQAQQALLDAYGKPVISFTLNIAGPVKVDAWSQYAFDEGRERILGGLDSMRLPITDRRELFSPAGRTLLLAVDGEAAAIKKLCVLLEDGNPLGRLFDIDVLDARGEKMSRPRERCCLICGKEGRECASRRLHPLKAIQEKTRAIIRDHWLEREGEKAAAYAVRALLDEVCATPKPGLVDRQNCGSHRDMDIFTFCASAAALEPYFRRCFAAGVQDRSLPPDAAFARLQALGLEAERGMLAATHGVNTHKGAIYSLGLLCAAAGRTFPQTPDAEPPEPEALLAVCGQMAAVHENSLLGQTHGSAAKTRYGIGGVKQEAAAGFPAVKNIGLPTLRRAREEGLDFNDQCVTVLLHLIASVQDTNMVARGGLDRANGARQTALKLLDTDFLPKRETIEALDRAFIQENLSPGGCADLLAATLFLARQTKIMT